MSFAPSLVPVTPSVPPAARGRRRLDRGQASRRSTLRSRAQASPLFEEVPPAASGITWVHDNAMSPDRYLPETMGPGVAFCDFDNDGWLDIFMVNSGRPTSTSRRRR